MLDSRQIRSDLEGTARQLARRGFVLEVAAFAALEERRKQAQISADRVRAERNALSKAIGMAKGKGIDASALLSQAEALAAELATNDAAITDVQTQVDALLLGLPNILHATVPEGRDEASNIEVRRVGTPRQFDFAPDRKSVV